MNENITHDKKYENYPAEAKVILSYINFMNSMINLADVLDSGDNISEETYKKLRAIYEDGGLYGAYDLISEAARSNLENQQTNKELKAREIIRLFGI